MYNSLLTKKLKKLTVIKKPENKTKQSNWFLDLFVGLISGFVAFGIEILATAALGPVGGMLVGVAGDIGLSLVSDLILGRDPLSKDNIIFTIATTLITIPGRIRGINRIKKNKLNILSEVMDDDDFAKLAKEFNKIDLNDIDAVNAFERKYNQILKKYNLSDEVFNSVSDVSVFKKFKEKQSKLKNFLNQAEKRIRFINKKINLIDPQYAAKELTEFLLKKPKSFINKKITQFQKNLAKKMGLKTKERVKDILIPLNHTIAPWIAGIRLIPVHNAINYYHVIIVFDKNLTNKKKQVFLFNKPWKNIKKFINAPSAGEYYINNICWGWKIGKLIRNNKAGLKIVRTGFNALPMISKTLYQTISLFNSTVKIVNDIKNIDQKFQNTGDKILDGVIRGTTSKLKGFTLINSAVRSIEKNQNKYLVQTTVRKLTKNYKKAINNISINRVKKLKNRSK